MKHKIDPSVLAGIAKQVAARPRGSGELVEHAIELLAQAYPDLIDPQIPACRADRFLRSRLR